MDTPVIKVRTHGLLFDMDGVLISSLGSVERSWQIWAERHGLDVRETIKAAHGMRAIETVRTLRPDADHSAELKVIEDLEVADNEGLEVLEGVTSILRLVPQKFWTIVTSATERLARSRLAFAGVPSRSTLSPPTWSLTANLIRSLISRARRSSAWRRRIAL
jgi:sugar-phosphatase